MRNKRYFTLLLLFTCFFFTTGAYADPPNRVARLSYLEGSVSFSPAGVKTLWVPAKMNRPLVIDDRLWIDNNSRAELQLGSASLRIFNETSFRVLNLNDHIAQFELLQGSLSLHVRNIAKGEIYEIDTPNLAFKILIPGDYRFHVTKNATTVTVRRGKGIAYATNAAYKVKGPVSYRFSGQNLHHEYLALPAPDTFDDWSLKRERLASTSASLRYVSSSMIGYEDLDTYGRWYHVSEYGYVWTPTNVRSGWAPYRDGHWSWIYPWGWTWVDNQPWGFAPSHYGRWARHHNTWIWIPGRKAVEPVYAPALVVFIGGLKITIGTGIAWFPLGPRDVYVPPYHVSQQYFTNINVTNTTINNTHITNVYNNPASQTTYTNQTTAAVTAVPTTTFVESKTVADDTVPLTETAIDTASVSTAAEVAPDEASVAGATPTTDTTKPPESALDKVPVVLTPPPAPAVPFSEQDAALSDNAGKPLDEKEMDALKPAEKTPTIEVTPISEASIPEAKPEDSPKEIMPVVEDKAPPESVIVEQPAAQVEIEKPKTDNVNVDKAVEPATTDNVVNTEAEANKAAADKAEAESKAQADAAAAQAEADKAQAAQAEANRAVVEKEQAEQAAANAKEESDRAAANAQAEADRAAKAQAEADKANAEASQAEANKAAAKAQADADRAHAAEADANRAAMEKEQADQAAAKGKEEADRAKENAEQAVIEQP